MNRSLVPMAGLGAVLTISLVLILVITLRPWGGTNHNWNTHLNFENTVPSDYSRTSATFLDTHNSAPEGWVPVKPVADTGDGLALFVGFGCATCHGLHGSGGAVGPDLTGVSASAVRFYVRNGPDGMPAYSESDMSDEEIDAVFAYLHEAQLSVEPTPAATPVASPTAKPTATPVAQPTATPRPTPSSTPPPGTEPSPTLTATRSAPTPTPSPTIEATPEAPPLVPLADITYDPTWPEWYLTQGNETSQSSCTACHDLPSAKQVKAFAKDSDLVKQVITMAKMAGLSDEDAAKVIRYFLALRHDTAP